MSTANQPSSISVLPRHGLSVLATLLLASVAAFAQVSEEELRLPIAIDADSTNYDGKNSILTFKGLRLTQGNMGIKADEARATKLDFEDAVWRFTGNVVIHTDNGHIECDTADLRFTNHQLQLATINGLPATFSMQRSESTEFTHGEANQLDYNFELGIIEFSGNASITEGGNQISSDYLVYNIAEQRINAQSATDGDRVKIIYTPKPLETPETLPETSPQADPASDDENITDADGKSAP